MSRLIIPLEGPEFLPKSWFLRLSPWNDSEKFFNLKEAWLLPASTLNEKRFTSNLYRLSAMFAGLKNTPLTPE